MAGSAALLAADTPIIAGCVFNISGVPSPCVLIQWAGAAESPAGQALALAVINMICRVHRRVQLFLPDSELHVPTLVPATTLAEAGEKLAVAIDPFIDLAACEEPGPTLAIGDVAGTYWLGADGNIGHLAEERAPITGHPASFLGAGMAA